LEARGLYEICAECGWEDDDGHPCGPNGGLSLAEARAGYVATGRSDALRRLEALADALAAWEDGTASEGFSEAWRAVTVAQVAIAHGNGAVARHALRLAGLI